MQAHDACGGQGIPPGTSALFTQDFPVPSVPGLAFWEWDILSGAISYSPEWSLLLVLAQEEQPDTYVDWLRDRVVEEDKALLREAYTACVEGRNAVFDVSVCVERRDRSTAWLLLRGACAINASTGGRRLSGYATDVTRLRIDRRFLPRPDDNSETYRAMLENSPDLIIRFDRHLFPLYINPAISRYLPFPADELGSSTYTDLGISQEQGLFFYSNVSAVFEKGCVIKETATFDTQVQGERTGEYTFWPEFGVDGTVSAVICQMRDLTDQIRADQVVRLNEQRFAALYQLTQMQDATEDELSRYCVEQVSLLTKSAHGYLFVPGLIDPRKGRMYWTESVHNLVGTAALPADHIPQSCATREHSILGRVRRSGIINRKDVESDRVVLDCLPVQRYMIMPIMEEGRVACIASVCNKETDYDNSDLRQLELFISGVWLLLRRNRHLSDLRKAKEIAEAANRIKDEFLANVSHELRTPLNGMLSMLQLLQMTSLSVEQEEYTRTASFSGKALMRILSDILDYSRMESGKMDLHLGPFDLRATLLSTMSLFAGEARRKGLSMTVDIADLPVTLLGDDARVRQIVFNLVGNALKFTEQGGIALECSVLPYAQGGRDRIYMVVRDTGIGIPPEAHSTIFDAFTQIDSSSTRKYSGTGLGLGIVKRLLTLMGGSLVVESEVGEGTAIHCSLPFSRVSATPPDSMSPLPQLTGNVECCLDILVAEDDPVSQFALRTFLQRTGHRVVCVSNGQQALEALRVYPFDCLITDIQMPVMDGLEAARRIRLGYLSDIEPGEEALMAIGEIIPEADLARNAAVPRDMLVVALTAHAMSGDREHFLRMGMDLYLSKPVIMEELHAILAQVAVRIQAAAK